jgi:hypothetical protein
MAGWLAGVYWTINLSLISLSIFFFAEEHWKIRFREDLGLLPYETFRMKIELILFSA